MEHFLKHIASKNVSVRDALRRLDGLAPDAILFLVNDDNKLIGSLTDGDLRRGFIKGLGFEDSLDKFMHASPKFILQGQYNLKEIISLRKELFNVFPVVNSKAEVINVVNFRKQKSYLPIDAFLMAGGRGERLRPLTDHKPKPLLDIGGKPIIEHNIDRLSNFGIDDIWISLGYLGHQLEEYFKDGSNKSLRINYVKEEKPLGTAGALTLTDGFIHDQVLLMNSDLLTNIDFEDLFLYFEEHDADLVVVCIPYQVNIPYAVMEIDERKVKGFKEKPTYTHYSNAGIYLMKRSVLEIIPKGDFFNATDLMEKLIQDGQTVIAYPFVGYWLDIGKPDDFKKAEMDIAQIKFE